MNRGLALSVPLAPFEESSLFSLTSMTRPAMPANADNLVGLDLEFVAGHMQPSAEVLKFYRGKVAAFEDERAELFQRIADVEVCTCGATSARCETMRDTAVSI